MCGIKDGLRKGWIRLLEPAPEVVTVYQRDQTDGEIIHRPVGKPEKFPNIVLVLGGIQVASGVVPSGVSKAQLGLDGIKIPQLANGGEANGRNDMGKSGEASGFSPDTRKGTGNISH
jgi:hypothetical protein